MALLPSADKQPPVADTKSKPESSSGDDAATVEVHSGSESEPRDATAEEMARFPHVADRLPFAVWAVIVAGAAERFTYFGLIAPWQNYMQNPRDSQGVPGALGLGQATASNIYNAFFLFSFLTPMAFALVADIWLGRYKTLLMGLVLYLLGCLALVTSSLPSSLDAGAGIGGLVAALILVGLGAGSVKATFFPLLGDQYVQQKPQLIRRRNGKVVIVDGERTLQLMYNLYYWFTNIASLSSIPVTFLEIRYHFWAAYLLATAALCLSIVLFLVWSTKLRKVPAQGNVLPDAVRVMVLAARSGFKLDHSKASYQAANYTSTHAARTVPWSDDFVDQIKSGLQACRVIFSLLVFYLCINQMYNNLVSQAGQMRLGAVPNDMIQAFSGVACIVLGPPIQALYELLARYKIGFGPVARISVAFLFLAAAMAYAAGVQTLIYAAGPCFDRPGACEASVPGAGKPGVAVPVATGNDVSVWVQMPVYVLIAVAEILGFVTAFEYAYNHAPADMKTVVQALAQLTAGLASALSMAISPAAQDPHLVVMYACLAGAMGLSLVLFWWRFRKYDTST
ncbi:POT family-domain-containing protein [Cercophora scortea]|uniref:POT family-domain-containing protein n=1 Tax=Cercophora scortea TaxID=314031 RepID=A0AAE0IWJ2_9PEZI|nr:POT family-domain-containing protein [Cercophora scortea]